MAGTEKYCTLENSYRGVHGIYIVYDITNLNSLIKLDGWIKHIETVSILVYLYILLVIVLKCVSILVDFYIEYYYSLL